MNIQVKKLLFFLLTNACLLFGALPVQATEGFSTGVEDISVSSVSQSEMLQMSEVSQQVNYYILLSLLTLSLTGIELLRRKHSFKQFVFIFIKRLVGLRLKLQTDIFNIVKSFKRISHSTYYALYCYSF